MWAGRSWLWPLLITILLVIMSRAPATSSPSPHLSQENISHALFYSQSQQGWESKLGGYGRKMKGTVVVHEEAYKGLSTLGSRPPSCENKCGDCNPCEAIQVPAITDVATRYTNYEPEGWKCKCGSSFFNP